MKRVKTPKQQGALFAPTQHEGIYTTKTEPVEPPPIVEKEGISQRVRNIGKQMEAQEIKDRGRGGESLTEQKG